jgi:hypothetical protein
MADSSGPEVNIYVPRRSFFSFTFPCRYRTDAARLTASTSKWEESHRLRDLVQIEGESPFAELYMGWNDGGLTFALSVKGKSRYKIDPKNYWQGDCLELWIDTRDVKDSHSANRYCHHFFFLPGGSGRDGKKPIGRQTSIDKAREQAPPCPEESIGVALRRLKRGYQMEIRLPAVGMNGFQPREFSRLGFNYVLRDIEHGVQSWAIGRDPPLVHDPSTWGSIELID